MTRLETFVLFLGLSGAVLGALVAVVAARPVTIVSGLWLLILGVLIVVFVGETTR